MFAYVALQFRRWLRKPLGAGFLLAPNLMTAIFVILKMAGELGSPVRPLQFQDVHLAYGSFVPVLGALAVGNQLSAVIQEEVRLSRSSLLRTGELDGWKAVASFGLFGLILSVAFGTLGYVGAILASLLDGISATSWAPDILVTTLALTGMCPLAILCGFLFPRPVSLLVVNGASLVGGITLVSSHWIDRRLWYLAILHAVSFVLLALLWRRQSSRRW